MRCLCCCGCQITALMLCILCLIEGPLEGRGEINFVDLISSFFVIMFVNSRVVLPLTLDEVSTN